MFIVIVIQSSDIPISKRIGTLAVAGFRIMDLVIIIPYNPILMYITTLVYITRSQMLMRTKKRISSRRKKLIRITNIGSIRIL